MPHSLPFSPAVGGNREPSLLHPWLREDIIDSHDPVRYENMRYSRKMVILFAAHVLLTHRWRVLCNSLARIRPIQTSLDHRELGLLYE
jgi:hypothetical protein